MKKFLMLAIASVALFAASTAQAQNVLNYKEQGGARQVIGGDLDVVSGGEIDIESGGSLVIDSGATVTNAGVALPVIRTVNDTVANGQTSKTVTVTGATATSDCVATANEVATNAVYIRAAVAGSNQVVVTTSGDPGASNLDITVACFN